MVVATNLHCQIFVGGLNDSVSDEQLGQFFCPYEQLVHVKILVGKRCGLVQFDGSHCADVALKMLNGTQLARQNIRLSWGRSPSNKQALFKLSWIQTSGTVDLMDINLDMKLVEVLELLKIPICKMEAILDIEITCKAPNCSLCAIVYAFM
ncbi:hypothetical protein RHGRI_026283 [Rhododendron griersonianum]|uniref:RRM domain-containing protein n=1 Tax=Rhododendron griersonianum TaxID=479676 RepID=A0AAV6IS51_9ERIC|nr:hypothetical protein RHGRI_026283 [Rhododendron griersonianum]